MPGSGHDIWALQYFEKQDLRTTEGDAADIFSPGNLNTDAGPDFSQARLRIGDIHWVGNVEIHVRSSAWAEHHHGEDPAYESVILHVVWQDDVQVRRKDTRRLATVELRGRVNEVLIRNYRQLITSSFSIPCRKHLPSVRSVVKTSMVSRALAHRLEHKAEEVIATGKSCGMDWEDTTYQWLAGPFGFKINKEPFFQLARATAPLPAWIYGPLALGASDSCLPIASRNLWSGACRCGRPVDDVTYA